MSTYRVMRAFCVVACAAVAIAQAQTTVYRWVDKDGKVQFSDAPPPADAKDTSQRTLGGGGSDDGPMPYATRIAAQRSPVTLFTSPECGEACVRAKDLLVRRGIPFADKDPRRSNEDADELRKAVGALELPVMMVGSNTLRGFDEDGWQAALDTAGYSRTRLPGQATTPTKAP